MYKADLPLVSIVIPVYNGSNFMREAIDSALAQNYGNIEVLVVNDGSNDNGKTEEIALSYGDTIRYYKKENGGVSSALNLGIRMMKGEYFSWLSHDDKYLPEKVESQMKVILESKDQRLIALCGTKDIDAHSQDLFSTAHDAGRAEAEYLTWQEALIDVISRGTYSGCALLIPRAAFVENDLWFDESLRYTQDILMWMQLFWHEYRLVKTPGVHVGNRVHGGQLTQTGKDIYHRDCIAMGNLLTEPFAQKSTRAYNFLYHFAKYNAKYDNPAVVRQLMEKGKESGLISFAERIRLEALMGYGKVRPLIRRLYYRFFRKMKTQ